MLVAGVGKPAVRLQEYGRAKVFLGIPPVRRTRRTAAGAQDTFVKTIKLGAIYLGLAMFLALERSSANRSEKRVSLSLRLQAAYLVAGKA